jgi:hypothetical protein
MLQPNVITSSAAEACSVEKKNPADIRIAERSTPIRTSQTSGEGRTAESAKYLADERKNDDNGRMSVPRTKEILT